MKKLLLILPLLFLNWEYSLAQTALNYVVYPETLPQQEYQNVGKNYSVDLFTGIASMSVPIFGYNVDGLDLGISLNYNAKGITVDQISSEVGLGWQLMAGGFIERTVNGYEDELKVPARGSYPELVGIFNYPDAFTTYIQEAERDKYSCMIGGRSFDYVIDDTIGAVTTPKSEIRLTRTGPITIGGTTYNTTNITDEKGNVFEFNKVDYQWKKYNDTVIHPLYRYLLTKITTYSGQVITYKYTAPYEIQYQDFQDQQIWEDNTTGGWKYDGCADTAHVWHGTVTHLSEIDYPDGTVVSFGMAGASDKRCDLYNNYILDSITISKSYDNNVGNSLTYRFNYAYFNSDGSGNPELPMSTSCSSASNSLRLKLLSISKAGNDHGVAEPYYSFSYNSTRLPPRLFASQDWFGYFNGQIPFPIMDGSTAHFFDVPSHSCTGPSGTSTIGISKSPSLSGLQACILTSIQNGSGGETDLYYKAHTLSDAPTTSDVFPMPSDFDATNTYDGLCIDKIVYKDGFAPANGYTTTYSFSNGLRFYKGGYFWYPGVYRGFPDSGGTLVARYNLNHFVTPYNFYRNSNHGYSNVSVNTTSGTGETLSTEKYQFTNIVDEVTGRSRLTYNQTMDYMSGFCADTFKQAELGLLMKKESYDVNGNLMQKDTFQYERSDNPDVWYSNVRYNSYRVSLGTGHFFVPIYPWSTLISGAVIDTPVISRRYVPFQSSLMRAKYVTNTVYSNGRSQSNTYEYDFDGADNITNLRWTDSRGVHFNKYFRYSYNYVFSSPTVPVYYLPGLQFLTTTELLEHTTGVDSAISVETIKGVQNSIGLTFPYTYKSTSAVPFWADNMQDGTLIQAGTIFYPDLVLVASQTTIYDDHNNPLETKYLNQEKYSSAIWDTRIGQKVAEATNAKYRDIAYSSFEGPFLASGTDYNKGNWTFNPSFVTFVPYTSSIQPITGRYYFHLSSSTGAINSSNTLTNGKQYVLSFWAIDRPTVTNGGAGVTLTQQATKGSWHLYTAVVTGFNSTISISYPTVTDIDDLRLWPADATMTTYTYDPLFGVTSVCDEHDNIIYQNYDRFGRKTATRDINGNVITLNRTIIHGSDN
ncbi:hypothetical protein [Mucilaginibacter boryungensis]|uniref:YD repeat-containing protein n=1 Tax=Mucilaginibacter boryungensis TaxID=768480 RepID=A0ABR9XM29_9SPHI|nr:hypothetical protein [Mucilaginibacter boryungensis]MBE9668119.1 hypothetical protein [Mucilaginibacter boryungensis]